MAEMDNSDRLLQYAPASHVTTWIASGPLSELGMVELSFSNDIPEDCESWIAEQIGYSARQARRISTAALGEPVASFIRRMLLERAAGQLSRAEGSITAIAAEARYLSGAAFSKAFQDHFSCCPSDFRLLNRSESCLMPGYLLSNGNTADLPKSVRLLTAFDSPITFLYDGAMFLGRLLPNGGIDWSLP